MISIKIITQHKTLLTIIHTPTYSVVPHTKKQQKKTIPVASGAHNLNVANTQTPQKYRKIPMQTK